MANQYSYNGIGWIDEVFDLLIVHFDYSMVYPNEMKVRWNINNVVHVQFGIDTPLNDDTLSASITSTRSL
jgi:hypothetical protein